MRSLSKIDEYMREDFDDELIESWLSRKKADAVALLESNRETQISDLLVDEHSVNDEVMALIEEAYKDKYG